MCVCVQFKEFLQEANAAEKIKSLVDPALGTDYPMEAVWKVFLANTMFLKHPRGLVSSI